MSQEILPEHINTQKEYDDIVNIDSYHNYSFTCQCSNQNKVSINKAFDRDHVYLPFIKMQISRILRLVQLYFIGVLVLS